MHQTPLTCFIIKNQRAETFTCVKKNRVLQLKENRSSYSQWEWSQCVTCDSSLGLTNIGVTNTKTIPPLTNIQNYDKKILKAVCFIDFKANGLSDHKLKKLFGFQVLDLMVWSHLIIMFEWKHWLGGKKLQVTSIQESCWVIGLDSSWKNFAEG